MIMKKIKILIIAVFTLTTVGSFGQGFYTNLGYDVSFPLGNTKDFVPPVSFRGFTFSGGYFLNESLALEFRWSWHVFYDDIPFDVYESGTMAISGKQYRSINAFPMTFGAKYFFSSTGFRPYLGFGLGPYKTRKRTEMGIYYVEDRQWHFGLTPEAGFIYNFSSGVGIMANVRYDYMMKAGNVGTQSNISLSVGFIFSGGY
jgi:outer membrane protein